MYKKLIEKYINNTTYDDFKKYVKTNYKNITEEETRIIYNYIKTRWEAIYDEDQNILKEIKSKLSESTYKEIEKLLKMLYDIKKR